MLFGKSELRLLRKPTRMDAKNLHEWFEFLEPIWLNWNQFEVEFLVNNIWKGHEDCLKSFYVVCLVFVVYSFFPHAQISDLSQSSASDIRNVSLSLISLSDFGISQTLLIILVIHFEQGFYFLSNLGCETVMQLNEEGGCFRDSV